MDSLKAIRKLIKATRYLLSWLNNTETETGDRLTATLMQLFHLSKMEQSQVLITKENKNDEKAKHIKKFSSISLYW